MKFLINHRKKQCRFMRYCKEHDICTLLCIKQEQTQCPIEEKLRDSIMKRKMGVFL
jgi:hypothetical protein